jgi:LytS/YehU family sensor histidine kinase
MRILTLGFMFFLANSLFSQTEELLARKIKRIENVHFGITKKHNLESSSKDSVLQIIELKRSELAPHLGISFNELSGEFSHANTIKNWFLSYPEEYKSFVVYLEKYLRFNIL